MGWRNSNSDITESQASCIVSAANCVGVMGGGVAKAIKDKFPWCYDPYKIACKEGILKPGGIFVVRMDVYPKMKYPRIIHLSTKNHWKGQSKLEWVDSGCQKLRKYIVSNQVESVAIPRLGCGLGGLVWDDVHPIMERNLADLDCKIVVHYREE